MAKNAQQYVCESCGDAFAKWSGKCESCGEWNTLVKFNPSSGLRNNSATKATQLKTESIASANQHDDKRITTDNGALDELLGGGIVSGSVLLLAGEPGIGKSTLLMQLAWQVSEFGEVLYVSGEESSQQVAMRAKRLGVDRDSIKIANATSADDIVASIKPNKHKLIVVDSIQTVTVSGVNSAPGSVSQITNSLSVLSQAAKRANTALVVVGHVTKDGAIAGPKLLEHLVDVVLQFEGDRMGGFRLLRSVKNRFGTTNETIMYEMDEKGMHVVNNPSEALLEERQVADGSVIFATMQGSRPLLVEVQALVNTTHFGYPKRVGSGIDLNRLNLLIAVLSRRTKLNLSDKDIYVSVVGGIKINDPGADLAVCMAIASAAKGYALSEQSAVFGEVGLSGEIRHVPYAERRIKEAKKFGFSEVIAPASAKRYGASSAVSIKDALNKYMRKT